MPPNASRCSILVALVIAVAGCGIASPPADFAAYRVFRHENDVAQRVETGLRYLADFPEGEYRREVRRELASLDERYWDLVGSTIEGEHAYLLAFPGGQFAATARGHEQARENARTDRDNRARIPRLPQPTDRPPVRLALRDTIHQWTRIFASLDGWGAPMDTLYRMNTGLVSVFNSAPAPQCQPGGCRKIFNIDCSARTIGGTAESDSVQLAVGISTRGRNVVGAEITMRPNGLAPWWQCESQLAPDAEREQVERWSVEQLRGVVAAVFPEARVTPVFLAGELDGAHEDPPIPGRPWQTRWSYVVGCDLANGARIPAATDGPSGWPGLAESAVLPRGCLRIDGFVASGHGPRGPDEGLRLSWIAPAALHDAVAEEAAGQAPAVLQPVVIAPAGAPVNGARETTSLDQAVTATPPAAASTPASGVVATVASTVTVLPVVDSEIASSPRRERRTAAVAPITNVRTVPASEAGISLQPVTPAPAPTSRATRTSISVLPTFLLGSAGALMGAIVGFAFAPYGFGGCAGYYHGSAACNTAPIGAGFGLALGSALAASAIGYRYDGDGWLIAALGGAVLGAIPFVIAAGNPLAPPAAMVLTYPLSPLLAVLAYEMTSPASRLLHSPMTRRASHRVQMLPFAHVTDGGMGIGIAGAF